MDEFKNILTNYINEELNIIVEKLKRKEKLNNSELSFINHLMRWYERRKKCLKI